MSFNELRLFVENDSNVDQLTEWLQQADADIHAFDDEFMSTLLHWAATQGATRAMSALLQHDADPNFHNKYGATPLHWAARNNQSAAVDLLLNHEADPTLTDNSGQTALDLAKENNNHLIVNTLITAHTKRRGTQNSQQLESAAAAPQPLDTKKVLSAPPPPCGINNTGDAADQHLVVEIMRLQKQLQELSEEVLRAQQALSDQVESSMFNETTKEVDTLHKAVKGQTAELQRLTEENNELQEKLKHSEAVILVFKEEKDVLQDKLDNIMQEDAERLNAVEIEAKASMEQMEGAHQVQLSRLQRDMEKMSLTVLNLQTMEEELNTAHARLVLIEDEKQGLQAQNQAIQKQLYLLSTNHGANDRIAGRSGTHVVTEQQVVGSEIAHLQLENYELKEQLKVMDDLRLAVMKLQQDKLQNTVGSKILIEQNHKMHCLEIENEKLHAEVARLKHKGGVDINECSLTSRWGDEEPDDVKELRLTKMKLEIEIEELAALQHEVYALRRTKAAVQAEANGIVQLQGKVNALTKQNEELRTIVISKDKTIKQMQQGPATNFGSTKKLHHPIPPIPKKPGTLPPMPRFGMPHSTGSSAGSTPTSGGAASGFNAIKGRNSPTGNKITPLADDSPPPQMINPAVSV